MFSFITCEHTRDETKVKPMTERAILSVTEFSQRLLLK
jgi:hypothetical protein